MLIKLVVNICQTFFIKKNYAFIPVFYQVLICIDQTLQTLPSADSKRINYHPMRNFIQNSYNNVIDFKYIDFKYIVFIIVFSSCVQICVLILLLILISHLKYLFLLY